MCPEFSINFVVTSIDAASETANATELWLVDNQLEKESVKALYMPQMLSKVNVLVGLLGCVIINALVPFCLVNKWSKRLTEIRLGLEGSSLHNIGRSMKIPVCRCVLPVIVEICFVASFTVVAYS